MHAQVMEVKLTVGEQLLIHKLDSAGRKFTIVVKPDTQQFWIECEGEVMYVNSVAAQDILTWLKIFKTVWRTVWNSSMQKNRSVTEIAEFCAHLACNLAYAYQTRG